MAIIDDYQPLDIIGRGSFGCVRQVRRRIDGKIFVRKEISYNSMNAKEAQQLKTEFIILKSLAHPNIVQYISHGSIPDKRMVHIYMEYCDGGDLAQLIKYHKEAQKCIPEIKIWRIVTQVLLALYRCHYCKNIENVGDGYYINENEPRPSDSMNVVIHRDIKPDNIFMMKDEYTVKLGDFGLAKLLKSENEFAKTYVGTPYYMSPEVLMDGPYSPVCDIWSLGCVIYELCCLRPPFQAKTHLSLQEKIKKGDYQEIPDYYSDALKLVIKACLICDPDERASVNQLLQTDSFRPYRLEWEMKQKEKDLIRKEKELILREATLNEEAKKVSERIFQCNKFEQETREDYRNYILVYLQSAAEKNASARDVLKSLEAQEVNENSKQKITQIQLQLQQIQQQLQQILQIQQLYQIEQQLSLIYEQVQPLNQLRNPPTQLQNLKDQFVQTKLLFAQQPQLHQLQQLKQPQLSHQHSPKPSRSLSPIRSGSPPVSMRQLKNQPNSFNGNLAAPKLKGPRSNRA